MIRLGINIDHIATLRQARREGFPDPVSLAAVAVQAGADGITAHLREDRRHIQDEDIVRLKNTITVPLNLEMAITSEMVQIACEKKPHWCCLVPEKRQELTTEGGLNLSVHPLEFQQAIQQLHQAGIKVSVFIDPDAQMIVMAKEIGADAIEIHTGPYARSSKRSTNCEEKCTGSALAQRSSFEHELKKIVSSAKLAHEKGLIVNAGHGLDYDNVGPLVQAFPFYEFNIGFAVIARALETGLASAVNEMKERMKQNVCVES
ncbi:pyridoxine 5'-phosphate synthase [bacterium F11]|nr:pyridoxine 5'-phosphate synthase [bacterium F11]